MSANISISGGSPLFPDRAPVQSAEVTQAGAVLASNTTPESSISTQITNMTELKKAEMSGRHFSVSEEQVVKALEQAIKAMQGKNTSLEFSVHDETKRIAVKVLDKETGELIREVPPEKSLDFIAKMWEMAGLFVDERR